MIVIHQNFLIIPHLIENWSTKNTILCCDMVTICRLYISFFEIESNNDETELNHERGLMIWFFFMVLFIGAMCGGRIGYMFFYGTRQLINNPVSLFYIFGKEALVFSWRLSWGGC